jgi:uncharacterized protein with PIN domain/putative ubiquitin-RnfH superfamily antitoxin RatB of RatAB toxin-antitoxin module
VAKATLRFYAELNGFLAPWQRRHDVEIEVAPTETVKHAIEALGVPHTEVELVLVGGASVGLEQRLADGDRVAVYPRFEALDITPLLRVRERPLRATRFVADSHLGGLARRLRLAGFDTLFDNSYPDEELLRLSLDEGRIVLTRDRELLKRRELTHGCFVHAQQPDAQWREVIERLDLRASARPFTRCLACNAPLHAVPKAQVAHAVPPSVRERHERFAHCGGCDRVYWEGSHWQRMRDKLDTVLHASDTRSP